MSRSGRRIDRPAAGVLALLLLLGCTAEAPGGTGEERRSVASSPASRTAPGGSASTILDCAQAIDRVAAPPDDYTVVLGSVALSLGAPLETSPSGQGEGPTRLFAKSGLVVRSGVAVQLSVLGSWTGRARIGWGRPARPAAAVRVPACPAEAGDWLVFAGGYWVSEPSCVPIEVRASDRGRQVPVGVGQACSD